MLSFIKENEVIFIALFIGKDYSSGPGLGWPRGRHAPWLGGFITKTLELGIRLHLSDICPELQDFAKSHQPTKTLWQCRQTVQAEAHRLKGHQLPETCWECRQAQGR